MNDKYQTILDNYINGNVTDFRKGVKSLKKIELIEFIEYWDFITPVESIQEIFKEIKKALL